MKKLILMLVLSTSLSSFAYDNFVLCEDGKTVIEAQRKLNRKSHIPIFKSEILSTNSTDLVMLQDYKMTSPTISSHGGRVLLCVTLNKI